MNRSLQWAHGVLFGAAETALLGSFVLLLGVVVVSLMLPLVVRGDRVAALSGLLLGFCRLWLPPMPNQLATGGSLDEAATWEIVGTVSLAPTNPTSCRPTSADLGKGE